MTKEIQDLERFMMIFILYEITNGKVLLTIRIDILVKKILEVRTPEKHQKIRKSSLSR